MAAKINMRLDKNPMPSQDPNVRNKNFLEVALGYTEEQALDEAARCLHCKNHPCVDGCPVNVRIPEFIAKIVERDYEGAYQVIHQTSSLPAVCGRVCPQESQCEMHCVRGKKGDPVGIGRLERFVADWHNAHSTEAPEKPQPNGHKVAVVGSGPAGLTCAGDLAKKGYDVTVFEALHLAGGVLVYGIPEFRLPKSIVQKEVDGLKAMGVKVETNTVVGRTITIDELMEENGFEAVFIGSGAGLPMFMNIPGENLKGVYSANEFLTRINLMKAYLPDSDTPIMVGFEDCRAHYKHPEKVVVTGTPVRGDFFTVTKQQAKEKLGMNDGRKLIVSFWGSLGSNAMNRAMAEFLALESAKEPFYHIHGVGEICWKPMQQWMHDDGLEITEHPALDVREYIYDMATVMRAADLVICRAGASTLSELTALGVPAILVPSPNVTNHHQEKNAALLGDHGAALVLPEEGLDGKKLFAAAAGILNDPQRMETMSQNMAALGIPDATKRIYDTVMTLLK